MKQPRGEERRKGSLIKEWAGRDGVGRGGEKGCFARRELKKGEGGDRMGGETPTPGEEKGESEGQSRESSIVLGRSE